jgi:hypothetical protein
MGFNHHARRVLIPAESHSSDAELFGYRRIKWLDVSGHALAAIGYLRPTLCFRLIQQSVNSLGQYLRLTLFDDYRRKVISRSNLQKKCALPWHSDSPDNAPLWRQELQDSSVH